MIDFEKEFTSPQFNIAADERTAVASVFRSVYGWMCAGLALSGVVAWYTVASGLWKTILTGGGFAICIVAELALVIVLSAAIRKLSAGAALLMFLAYAALNGLTLSVVFIAYDLALVQRVFFMTAAMFGGLAVWGSVTKSDLSSVGSVCGMALWGLVVASIANIFFKSSSLDWICSFAGILIFSGLTMYDAQKIRALAASGRALDEKEMRKIAIIGSLELYLDFINLFLHILRFFGRRR